MDLFDVVRSCFRRWYVMLPLLLATGWFAHNTYVSVKPIYYSSAVIGLAPANSQIQYAPAGGQVPRNGLLDAGGVSLMANMAVLRMRDPVVIGQVVAAGGRSDYGAKMFPGPASAPQLPLIMIEMGSPTPESTTKTLQLAASQADPVLRAIQQESGVPDELMVRAISVSPPSQPVVATPSRTKATITIVIAGVLLAVLVTVIIDVISQRWSARRSPRKHLHTAVGIAVNPGENQHRDSGPSTSPRTAERAVSTPFD